MVHANANVRSSNQRGPCRIGPRLSPEEEISNSFFMRPSTLDLTLLTVGPKESLGYFFGTMKCYSPSVESGFLSETGTVNDVCSVEFREREMHLSGYIYS